MSIVQTQYLSEIFFRDEYQKTISRSLAALEQFDKAFPFESIAFTGTSGAALAFPLALLLGKQLTCLRKGTSHHYEKGPIEGCLNPKGYIIVDDFVESGQTVLDIRRELDRHQSKLMGIYLLRPTHYMPKVWDMLKVPFIFLNERKFKYYIEDDSRFDQMKNDIYFLPRGEGEQ